MMDINTYAAIKRNKSSGDKTEIESKISISRAGTKSLVYVCVSVSEWLDGRDCIHVHFIFIAATEIIITKREPSMCSDKIKKVSRFNYSCKRNRLKISNLINWQVPDWNDFSHTRHICANEHCQLYISLSRVKIGDHLCILYENYLKEMQTSRTNCCC